MPSWRLFYRGLKGGVELCFLGLLELFPEYATRMDWQAKRAFYNVIRRSFARRAMPQSLFAGHTNYHC
jgi:hypothetical protein